MTDQVEPQEQEVIRAEVVDGQEEQAKAVEVYKEPEHRLTLNEISEFAVVFEASGLFKDTQKKAQAMVKIIAGQELGIPPFAAMRGFDIIQGKLAPGAHLVGALIKRPTNPYDYRVLENSDTRCAIEFFSGGKPIGTSVFTLEDAQRANLMGKDNWRKFPRQMLFARAMTEGARSHCPDVFMGSVYDMEELEGPIELPDAPPAQIAPQSTAPEDPYKATWDRAAEIRAANDGAMPPDKLKTFVGRLSKILLSQNKLAASEAQRKLLAITLSSVFDGKETDRHVFCEWLTGHKSTKEMDGIFVNAILDWMQLEQTEEGGYIPTDASLAEARSALRQAHIELDAAIKSAIREGLDV